MLAEDWSPDSLASVNQWKSSTSGENVQVTGLHNRQQGGLCQRRTSNQRSCFFGLETNPELLWEDWDLGGEFTKTLVLKNIHNKLQKLHIRPPVSQFFSISILQVVVLGPGTSFSLPVTFRPVQKCVYEDSIEFQGKEGSFQVSLRSIIPCPVLEIPDSVMLPLCAVQYSSQTTLLLKNVSKIQTLFEWSCAAPFHLSPEQGLLKPGQECHITVVFQPQEARVYQQQAYCRFGEEVVKADTSCSVLLLGLAKYPYLQLRIPNSKKDEDHSHPELHFGSVALGRSLSKQFDIFNPSPVNVPFLLSRLPGVVSMFESEFICNVTSGDLAPGGSVQVSVSYSPAVVDKVSVDYLSLKYKGSPNEPRLKLIGKCFGPKVSLSSIVLDFGCIKEKASAVQTVEVVNSSSAQAVYQWNIDCRNSVFRILPASGTILPHSHVKLKAIYKPKHPMVHYRRVACLILHGDPLFLDLIGTCHSELQQPEILKPEHLVLHKHQNYLRKKSPDSVHALQQEHGTQSDQQGVLLPTEEINQKSDISTTPMEEFYRISVGSLDSFSPTSSSSSPHVSVEPSELLFNHKMTSSLSPSSSFSQSVSITNFTRGKLRLVWTVAEDSPFSVSPSSCDLVTLKSTSFRVTYDPKQPNTLHGGELECFAYYKDSSDVLCPPWCVTVRVTGHSFQPGIEHFTPSCSLKPHQVVFPALAVTSYRTVLLQNDGDLPLIFCLCPRSNDASIESMYILPGCGLIQPRDHQIITIRAIPTEDNPKQGFSLLLQLNASKFTKELKIISVVEKPCLSLESQHLYFHPTAVGSKTQRTHHIRNLSSLPLQFQWSISDTEQKLTSVIPEAGELHPNESSIQTWSFSPLAEKTYTLTPTLNFWPVQSDGSNKLHLTLEVVGMGSRGSLKVEEAVLDVGDTLVESCRLVEIPLINNSPCTIFFHLSVQQIRTDLHPEGDQSALNLDCETGTIVSHSTLLLQSSLRICTKAEYLWSISYQILDANGIASCPPRKLCEVRAKGVFPTLQVVDACSGGSVSRLSKVYVWKLLSLDSLNEHLLSAPSPTELTFKIPTKHSLLSCPSTFTKVMLDFDFGSAPLNSDPSEFMLMFHNPGGIPVDWALLFPEDQQIELEDWAVTGEFSSSELHQMKVQDNQLFSVAPRSGTLLPGQQRAVHFTFSHDFIGTYRLPVVFKLSYGREILLNFQGVTVERDKPYLHFAPSRHVFTSVAIGDCSPPQQMYELYNGGAVPVRYEVDRTVLSQLQVDNFNHPVMRCLNPEGEVLPGKTAVLEWIFSPLEAKLYQMEVPIRIQEKDAVTVRFEGRGVKTLTLDSSNSLTCSRSKTGDRCVQREPFPGQVLFLSEDSVFLGDIPVCSQSSRILFLTNVSDTDTVHYIWELPQQSNQKVVQIHPEQGRLCPGECTLCTLTFIPTDYPTVYQLDLLCQVTLEAVLAQYHDALKRWDEEKERQQNEFIITDKNVSENQRVLIDEKPRASPARKGPPLRKYEALPPISASRRNEAVGSLYAKQTRAERRLQREVLKKWRRPQPPQPALLHLSVTAHSHGLPDYFTHFPDQYQKYHRNLQLMKTQQTVPISASTSSSAGLLTPTHGPERDVLTYTLTRLLRDILEDSAFDQSGITLVSKPRAYQPTNMPSTHCTTDSSTPCTPSSSPSSFTSPQPHVLLNGTMDREQAVEIQNTLQSEHAPADLCEIVLKNTLQNLMTEAVRGELVLTAHPRTIILPPLSLRRRQVSKPATEEKE